MRGGKYYFSVAKADAPKFERKSPNFQSKKTNGVKRKNVRRQHIFKSDNWYETAVLSVMIKREPVF